MKSRDTHEKRDMVNRSDAIIKNRKEKTCTLVDVAIPAEWYIMQMKVEKKIKYKRLCKQMQRMGKMEYIIIQVVNGATGILTKDLEKNLEAITGKHSVDSLQKTAVLGASHKTQKYCSLTLEA